MDFEALKQANHLRVDDALNKALEAEMRLAYDKDAGYTSQRGISALERKAASRCPTSTTKFGKVVEEIGAAWQRLPAPGLRAGDGQAARCVPRRRDEARGRRVPHLHPGACARAPLPPACSRSDLNYATTLRSSTRRSPRSARQPTTRPNCRARARNRAEQARKMVSNAQ